MYKKETEQIFPCSMLYSGASFDCDRGKQKRLLHQKDKWFQSVRRKQG